MAAPDRFEALARRIDADRLVERTVEMIRIPSVNPFDAAVDADHGESGMADHLGGRLAELGWEPDRNEFAPGRPNVWGSHPGGGGGPTLLLAGHLDTVGVVGHPDPFGGAVGEGRIRGRGACDMKGALAAYLEVATVLDGEGLAGQLRIAGIADEEHEMRGSAAYADHGPTADWCIVGEPTSLRVCAAHLGQFSWRITTEGRAAHSSRPELGVNAIEQMAKVLTAIGGHRVEIAARPPHPLCGVGRISPGRVRGGDEISTVPDHCELDIDRRVVPGEDPEDAIADLGRVLDGLAAGDPSFAHRMSEPLWRVDPLDTPLESPLVVAVLEAAEALGLDASPTSFTGSTDAPNLGVPAVICGPGSLARAHTVDEWVAVDELVAAARLYLHAALSLVG